MDGILDCALDMALEAAFDYLGDFGADLADAWRLYVTFSRRIGGSIDM